jgi:hypothetical protein
MDVVPSKVFNFLRVVALLEGIIEMRETENVLRMG